MTKSAALASLAVGPDATLSGLHVCDAGVPSSSRPDMVVRSLAVQLAQGRTAVPAEKARLALLVLRDLEDALLLLVDEFGGSDPVVGGALSVAAVVVHLDEVKELCDTVTVIDEGTTKFNGDLDSFSALADGSLHQSFLTTIGKV